MSFIKEIEAPYTLASLPKPIDSTNGQTQVAGVSSLSGSRKRKRTEVAVGVDGEGVFIYSVQNPELITSYAVPPQAYFTTAPCSLYRKGSTKRPSCRFTYVSIAQSTPGEKLKLVCFTEEIQRDNANTPVKSVHILPDDVARLVSIDVVPIANTDNAKSDSHDVLVVFDDGRAMCLSSELQELRWDSNLRNLAFSDQGTKATDGFEVEHLTLTTAKATLRGLLKSREDIAALLDPTLEAKSDLLDITSVLCIVLRRSNQQDEQAESRILSLFHLQPRASDVITTHVPPVKHLLTWDFPPLDSLLVTGAVFSIQSTNGRVHHLQGGVLTSYDFSTTVPQILSQLEISGFDMKSFTRISSDSILALSNASCAIFDVKYNSVQAILPLETEGGQNDSRKRKQPEDGVSSSVSNHSRTLISYFAEHGLAVGISNQELFGLQVVGHMARKRARVEESLLIDSIGRGIRSKGKQRVNGGSLDAAGPDIPNDAPSHHWQKRVGKLDKLVSRGKVLEFEDIFAREVKVELGPPGPETPGARVAGTSQFEGKSKPDSEANGVTDTAEVENSKNETTGKGDDALSEKRSREWVLPRTMPNSQRQKYRQQAMYALGKMFSWNTAASKPREELSPVESTRSSIKVEFFAPNVFEWLLLSGYLTKESIQRALLGASPDNPNRVGTVSDGDVVKAVVDFDADLHILSVLLNHGTFLPLGEVVQAIKLVIQSLNDRPKPDDTVGLLTNGTNDVADAADAMDVDVASELEAATKDLDHALSILDQGVAVRSHTLRPALIRLHTFPPSAITSALRSSLSRSELESLIRLLQSEFKNGGWASPYQFGYTEAQELDDASEDPDDEAVAIIASLLSCSLDAIGTGAFLANVGDSGLHESTEDLINELYEETNVALNGFWEAVFMRGLLSEFLQYTLRTTQSNKPSSQTLQKQGKPMTASAVLEHDLPMLPLGGKPDLGVEKSKPGKNGKREERSAREMGMLISKRVPKYSFERIVL